MPKPLHLNLNGVSVAEELDLIKSATGFMLINGRA